MKALGFPAGLVDLVASQSPSRPFHALPHEYPFLALIPFTLGLIVPVYWYQVAFAAWMALVAGIVYFILKRFRSTGAAPAFVIYLMVGNWATAEGRFDLIPAALTLIALICAERARWKWAFALLALATLCKFYPLVLLPAFFVAQQIQHGGKWYSWRRLVPLGVFGAVCVGVMAVSLWLSVEGTIAPFGYFGSRPIQVESSSASVLWLASFFGYRLNYDTTFGSLNMVSALSPGVALGGTILLAVGLLYTFWLQWRGKIQLSMAILLTLLIVIFTGKVFSPQYLLWVAPIVAYVGKGSWKWLISWGGVGLLTTVIYPYIYGVTTHLLLVPFIPAFYPVVLARNVLLLGFIVVLLYQVTRSDAASINSPTIF